MENSNNDEGMNLSPEEQLLFFDVIETGYLTTTEGEFYEFGENLFYMSKDNDSIIRSQNKMFPLTHLGKEYENIYITYIPAKELDYYPKSIIENTPLTIKPLLPLQPLIKISKENKENKTEYTKCYLSGKRSAIYFEQKENLAIRLKGCGNLFIGFNLANVDDLGTNHLEIRGAQFKNTCFREQFITDYVNKECKKRGLICGNIPYGYYRYQSVPECLTNEAPLCDKYCGLFLTYGDKRLGSNFFNGLNFVLESLLSDENYANAFYSSILGDFNAITKHLPQKNFKVNDESGFTNIEFNEAILDNPLLKRNSIADDYKTIFFDYLSYLINHNKEENKDKGVITEICKLEKQLIENLLKTQFECFTQKHGKSLGEFSINFDGIQKLIDRIFNEISNSSSKTNLLSLIILILSKISHELGKIKRTFEEIDLNWGTYDYHCNAHLDNFLILPSNKKKLYLAPLDFDLGFKKEEFVDINYKEAKGIETSLNFDELLEREKNNLIVQLIGFNMIPNIDVSVLEFAKIFERNPKFKQANENLQTLIKENLVEYYTRGYLKTDDLSPLDDFYSAGQDLVKLVLYSEMLSR